MLKRKFQQAQVELGHQISRITEIRLQWKSKKLLLFQEDSHDTSSLSVFICNSFCHATSVAADNKHEEHPDVLYCQLGLHPMLRMK